MLTIQKKCAHEALDDTGMMAFQHVSEGIKRSESKIGGFYFHFMRKIKVNKTFRRRHMKLPKKGMTQNKTRGIQLKTYGEKPFVHTSKWLKRKTDSGIMR